MSQADYDIANQLMDAARTDLNLQLVAGVTNNSGLTEPATKFAYMWWPDTTTGILKQRNAANDGWINKGTLSIAFVDFTSAKDSKLTGIESSATADQTGAEIKSLYEAEANAFTDTKNTKLTGIEASADVTDTTNVTAAGALMDSEVDANLKTFVLPASTTISAFGATLIDDAAASNARTTLGVQPTASPTFTGSVTAPFYSATATGMTFGSLVAASVTDLSKHIRLWGTTYGFNITSGNLNIVSNAVNVMSFTSTAVAVKVALTTTSTIDGRDVAADGTKLDLIEGSATADQTGAEIKTLYEAQTNAFTDTKNTKLTGIESSATADQTGAEIKTLYEAQANAFTDTKNTKLTGISTGAEVNPALVTQAVAEAGTSTTELTWSALRVKQAIDALGGSGSGITLATAQATTSGTAFDFTGITAGTKRIMVIFLGVSLSGTNHFLIQLGDSGGFEITGYVSTSGVASNGVVSTVGSSTAGFRVNSGNAGRTVSGIITLTRLTATHDWVSSHSTKTNTGTVGIGGGNKALSAELTQIRITRTGTNTFDAGGVTIMYEV